MIYEGIKLIHFVLLKVLIMNWLTYVATIKIDYASEIQQVTHKGALKIGPISYNYMDKLNMQAIGGIS